MAEYTTDEEGHKRAGFIEGESVKMSPLPEEGSKDKEKEKEGEEKAIKAMESLTVSKMRKRLIRRRMRTTTMALTLVLWLRKLSFLYLLLQKQLWKRNPRQRVMCQIVLLPLWLHLMLLQLYVGSFVVLYWLLTAVTLILRLQLRLSLYQLLLLLLALVSNAAIRDLHQSQGDDLSPSVTKRKIEIATDLFLWNLP